MEAVTAYHDCYGCTQTMQNALKGKRADAHQIEQRDHEKKKSGNTPLRYREITRMKVGFHLLRHLPLSMCISTTILVIDYRQLRTLTCCCCFTRREVKPVGFRAIGNNEAMVCRRIVNPILNKSNA